MAYQQYTFVDEPQNLKRARQSISPALWGPQKWLIKKLYIDHNKTLNEVIGRLRKEPGFSNVKERHLTYRLNQWGLLKRDAASTPSSVFSCEMDKTSGATSITVPAERVQSIAAELERLSDILDGVASSLACDTLKPGFVAVPRKHRLSSSHSNWNEFNGEASQVSCDDIAVVLPSHFPISNTSFEDPGSPDGMSERVFFSDEDTRPFMRCMDSEITSTCLNIRASESDISENGSATANIQDHDNSPKSEKLVYAKARKYASRYMIDESGRNLYPASKRLLPGEPHMRVCSERDSSGQLAELSSAAEQGSINDVQPTRREWSIRSLVSAANDLVNVSLTSEEILEFGFLAEILSSVSLHKEAFTISRLVVLQIMYRANRHDLKSLVTAMTRLAKNSTTSSDCEEVLSIFDLAKSSQKFFDIMRDLHDPACVALMSYIEHNRFMEGGPCEIHEQCECAYLISTDIPRGRLGDLAEIYSNCRDTASHTIAWTTQAMEIHEEMNETWNSQYWWGVVLREWHCHDELDIVCLWIRDVISQLRETKAFFPFRDATLRKESDRVPQADLESGFLICNLWSLWQQGESAKGSPDGRCKKAFELLQESCGLNQAELMSALGLYVLRTTGRGAMTKPIDGASHHTIPLHRFEEPRLQAIAHVLNAHIEQFSWWGSRSFNPVNNYLRQERLHAYVEANIKIPDVLFLLSNVRLTAPILGRQPNTSLVTRGLFIPNNGGFERSSIDDAIASPFLAESLRSSCSSGLTSFKDIHLRQLAMCMPKSSSRRLSQLSDISIATFSSSDRWLKKHATGLERMSVDRPTSSQTYISPLLLVQERASTLFALDDAFDRDEVHSNAMDLDTEISC